MKKNLFGLLAFVCFAVCSTAQTGYTLVTATISSYAGGSVIANFVNQGGGAGQPMLNGNPIPTSFPGTINSSGVFSLLLPSNALVSQVPSCWQFKITTGGTANQLSFVSACLPISGSSVNISSYFSGAPTPPSTGGGSLGAATDVIAASNTLNKTGATAVCSGADDQTCINAVITARCSAGQGGKVVLLNGTFSVSGSVVIPCGNLELAGLAPVMWGGYSHSSPCTVGSPCGILGNDGAIIKATAAGFDIVRAVPTVPCGLSDNTRCRGVTVENLYIQGYQYSNTGISLENNIDVSWVKYNMIQRTQTGIAAYCDTCQILNNDIQDNGTGPGIFVSGVHGTVQDNLIWDNNGSCVISSSYAALISGNFCGDLTIGISVSAGFNKVTGNHLKTVAPPLVEVNGYGASVTGNTMDNTNSATSSAAAWILSDGAGDFATVNNNTAFATLGQGGPFLNLANGGATGTNSIACGNAISGGWNAGGEAYFVGAATACPNVPGFKGGGTYSAATAYTPGTFVRYGGVLYISIASTTGNVPTNTTYWTPVTTVIPQAQYIASSITDVSTGGGTITTWPDSSGWGGRALSVAAGGPKLFGSSNISGSAAVRFSGGDRLQETELQFGSTQPRTVFVVVNAPTYDANMGIIGGSGVSTPILGTNNGTSKAAMYSNFCSITTCLSASALANSTTYAIEYVLDGANSRIVVNGTANPVANATTSLWTVGLVVGMSECGNACFDRPYVGDIAEIVVLSGGMSNADANVEGAALCTKYGLTCSTSW